MSNSTHHPLSSSTSTANKSLRFSSSSQVILYEDQQPDKSQLFYSNQEYHAMEVANIQAIQNARRARSLLASRSDIQNEDIQGIDCIINGLENFLTREILRKVIATKQDCIQAVLLEQDRQINSRNYDPKMLACTSERTISRWSSGRAQVIASAQAELSQAKK